jgi:hypothetical protein
MTGVLGDVANRTGTLRNKRLLPLSESLFQRTLIPGGVCMTSVVPQQPVA